MSEQLDRDHLISLPYSKNKIAFTACHKIPERSFHWKGNPLLCYRCLGIDLGVIVMFLFLIIGFFLPQVHPATLLTIFIPNTLLAFYIFSLGSQVPFIADGGIQAMTRYESFNPIRFLTGLLGGIGQFFLLFSIGGTISWLITLVLG